MPPYYALGFFQGTDAYDMQMLVPYVLDGYASNDFPLEGMILEQYNVDKDRIFTLDYL